MRLISILFLSLIFSVRTYAVAPGPVTVRAVQQLSEQFMEGWALVSENRSIWNQEENEKYKDPFFARQFLNTKSNPYHVKSFEILDSINGFVQVRFSFVPVKPGSEDIVVDLYAGISDGSLRLFNALPVRTMNWERVKIGEITFAFPNGDEFDEKLGSRSADFYKSLGLRFGISDTTGFEYLIPGRHSGIGELLGFPRLVPEDAPGLAMSHRRVLITGNGSPWYPHEISHMLFGLDTLHPLLNEGFATWMGGAMARSYNANRERLARTLETYPGADFEDLLSGRLGSQAFYASGAVLLEHAMKVGGVDAVKELLKSGTDNKAIIVQIALVFDIKERDVSDWWRKLALGEIS